MPALHNRAAHFLLKRLGLFNRSYREDYFGSRFVVPIINGRKTYVSEPWMAQAIARLFALREGGFVDVGVNLGQTLLKVAAADRTRPYVGFEPNPTCTDYAQALVAANRLPYAIVPAGLGPQTQVLELQMFRTEDTDPSASLVPGFREGRVATRPVVVIGVSDLPPDLLPATIAVIKIDVEGGEAAVLEGLAPVLAEKRPYVLVEILPAYNAGNLPRLESQARIEHVFSHAGYALFRIRKSSADTLEGIERITEIGIHGDLALADYLMVPNEDAERVLAELQS